MKSLPELQGYVRFQLDQLGARNQHHLFEDLCRELSRTTICERVIPATGPVAGSGDQGRDFETFRSYLSSTPIATSLNIGNSNAGEILVFACTVQRERIEEKIKADIETILNGANLPSAIYFFSVSNVKVAVRHRLQEWCSEVHRVHLEILDGEALAGQLSNVNNFWIAASYLNVPAEMYPIETDASQQYLDYKLRWLESDRTPQSYADFYEIKYGLRKSTVDLNTKPDLTRWIEKIEHFLYKDSHATLRRSAIYEICVASLRGLNNLTQRKTLLEDYFSSFKSHLAPSAIRDATVLLTYCTAARYQGHLEIDKKSLENWSVELIELLEDLIQQEHGPGYYCSIAQLRGQAEILHYQDGAIPVTKISDIFYWWHKLLDKVNDAPLYPLEDFADYLCALIEFLEDDNELLKLTARVDELLMKRNSGNTAAEKCLDRAKMFYDRKNFTRAINQLHQAKINWFTAESIRGSLVAILTLSKCYQELGLIQAAKQYAAAGLYVTISADNEDLSDLISPFSYQLGSACYSGGEWLNFADITKFSLSVHNAHVPDPQEVNLHEEMQHVLLHGTLINVVTNRLEPELGGAIRNVIETWPLDAMNKEIYKDLCDDPNSWVANITPEDLWERLEKELSGRPFAELGETRSIEWRALGIHWSVKTRNRYNLTSVAETLAACMQILLCDFSTLDLSLLPTKAQVECGIDDIEELEVEELPSNEKACIKVVFPRDWLEEPQYSEDLTFACHAVAVTLLGKCTMLRQDAFTHHLEEAYEQGLAHKISFIRPYCNLMSEFFPTENFSIIDREKYLPINPTLPFRLIEHENLKWIDQLGRGYSKEKSIGFIRNRYRRAIPPIRRSPDKWVGDESFQNVISKLQAEGYMDWHILVMVSVMAVNYRIKRDYPNSKSQHEISQLTKDLMYSEESADSLLVPSTIFTDESIDMQKKISAVTMAKTWDLQVNLDTPDFDALHKLLKVRYMNDQDDIVHENYFVPTTS